MSKFYAQSGSRSIVITAENAFEAASKLVDHALGDHVWIYGEASLTQNDRRAFLVAEVLLTMDVVIHVSTRGFGDGGFERSDAGTFDVADLVDQWHRLMAGLTRLFGQPV